MRKPQIPLSPWTNADGVNMGRCSVCAALCVLFFPCNSVSCGATSFLLAYSTLGAPRTALKWRAAASQSVAVASRVPGISLPHRASLSPRVSQVYLSFISSSFVICLSLHLGIDLSVYMIYLSFYLSLSRPLPFANGIHGAMTLRATVEPRQ